MNKNFKQIDEISVGNSLGEGVQWRAADQSIWWTDILEKKLYRYEWPTKKLQVIEVPEPLGSFAFTEQPSVILAAFASGFAYFNWQNGKIKWLHRPPFLAGEGRFNDGRADRQGRFWCGTIMANPEARLPATGRLFCLDTEQNISVHESEISISNGIGWSPDSKIFYFADSMRGNIYRYDFNADLGTLSGKQLLARVPRGGGPDGAAVDAAGHIWSAQWAAGKVLAFTSSGDIVGEQLVPASQPTCVAFGGPELNLMIVTSAADGLSCEQLEREPSAGHVFIFETDIAGLPEETYKGRAPSLR